MTIKSFVISNDRDHPFFGLPGRNIPSFKGLLERPQKSLQIIQDALHNESCNGCGRCCSGLLPAIPVKPDDLLFKIHLASSGKSLEKYHDGRDVFTFKHLGRCDFLDANNSCNSYHTRPSICRTYPFNLHEFTDEGVEKGIALGHTCPSIQLMRNAGIKTVFLSDIIFSISEALKNPEIYSEESRLPTFIVALNRLLKEGKKYYISPVMGSSLINIMHEYREGKTPYNQLSYSPFLMCENEVCFLF